MRKADYLFKSFEVGVKFYMLWIPRCLKHYYREVENSGRLEDKDFSAVAVLCRGSCGLLGGVVYGARCDR